MSLFQQNEMSSGVTVGHQKSQLTFYWVVQVVKNLPAIWETWVPSLGQEDPLEKEMATHSSILAWRIPWTEELGGLQSIELQRVGHDWVISLALFYRTAWLHSPVIKCKFMCLMQSEARQTKTSELRAGKGLLKGQARRTVAQGLVEVNLSTILDLFGFNQFICPWAMPFF